MVDDEWLQFAEIARALGSESSLKETLERGAAGAVELIYGCDYASITLVKPRRGFKTAAITNPSIELANELQYELDEGPGLQVIREQEAAHSRDLTIERKWPLWSPRVVEEVGIRSVLSVRLFLTDRPLGSLNLYSTSTGGFDSDDLHSVVAFGAQLSVAMDAAKTEQQLEAAVASRTVIGQAEGMLMQRYDLTPDQAFTVLQRVSQHTNRKLVTIATDIVRHGIRPELLGQLGP